MASGRLLGARRRDRARIFLATGPSAICLVPVVGGAEVVTVLVHPERSSIAAGPGVAKLAELLASSGETPRGELWYTANPQSRVLLCGEVDPDEVPLSFGAPEEASHLLRRLDRVLEDAQLVGPAAVPGLATTLAARFGAERPAAESEPQATSLPAPARRRLDSLNWLDRPLFARARRR